MTFSKTPVLRHAVSTSKIDKTLQFKNELCTHRLLGELYIAQDKRVISVEVAALF